MHQSYFLYLANYYYNTLLVILILLYIINLGVATEKTLYKPEDGILELDVNTFNVSVYNKSTAFVIEFYSSWCGHCIDYAPHYVEFSRLLKPWKNVVVVSAINCADEDNSPICRQHEIDAFPTIKYFKVWSKRKEDAVKYVGDKKNLAQFSLTVAEWLKADYDTFKPLTWPKYELTSTRVSIISDFLASDISNGTSLLCVIVEEDSSRHGFALMTNFYDEQRVRVVVVTPNHPIAVKFGGVQIPAIHIFSRRNADQVIYSSNSEITWVDMKNQVEKFLLLEPPKLQNNLATSNDKQKLEGGKVLTTLSTAIDWNQFEVQLIDLQKTLLYMLTVEIPRNSQIRGNELVALRRWIHMLKKYSPGTTSMRRLFYRIDEWLERTNSMTKISADEWLKTVERIQGDLGRPLPFHSNYLSCRGSEPKFRGYTCGLWTLFHAITVQAYKEGKTDIHFKPYIDVLEPIHQFVVQFLSCETCAKHFDKMTQELNMKETQNPEDVILWLWRAHNSVNKRLSGDATDDPKFRKQPFPPADICSKCRVHGSESFDEVEILNFLVVYYATVMNGSSQPEYQMKEFSHGKLTKTINRRLNPKFAGFAGKMDNLEEVDARLKAQQGTGPKREWKNIDETGYTISGGPATTDHLTFYFVWLLIVGLIFGLAYLKYRQNRSKFWKTFYYYNDYKLLPWRRTSPYSPMSSNFRKIMA